MIVLRFFSFSSFSSIETSVERTRGRRRRRRKKDGVNEEREWSNRVSSSSTTSTTILFAASRKTFHNDSLCIPRSFLALSLSRYSCITTDKKKVFTHSPLLSLCWSPSLMSYTRRQCRIREEKTRENTLIFPRLFLLSPSSLSVEKRRKKSEKRKAK